MFNRMKAGKEEGTSYRTEVSYLEIYNERVKDLLKKNSTHNLKVNIEFKYLTNCLLVSLYLFVILCPNLGV